MAIQMTAEERAHVTKIINENLESVQWGSFFWLKLLELVDKPTVHIVLAGRDEYPTSDKNAIGMFVRDNNAGRIYMLNNLEQLNGSGSPLPEHDPVKNGYKYAWYEGTKAPHITVLDLSHVHHVLTDETKRRVMTAFGIDDRSQLREQLEQQNTEVSRIDAELAQAQAELAALDK